MKIAVLWTRLAGYLDACLRHTAEHAGIELFESYPRPSSQAPFDLNQFARFGQPYVYPDRADRETLRHRLAEFEPDTLLVCGWDNPAYREICREYRGKCLRVGFLDNPWTGTMRQRLGVASSPFFVKKLFDVLFVPGERQAEFAARLGFSRDRVWRGALSCDHELMSKVYEERLQAGRAWPKRFLYLGRLAPEKGIRTLRDGYRGYRRSVADPWPLLVVGTGPLLSLLEGEPGVELQGFLQPAQVPEALERAGCLVLPSDWDHWGVAIHEGCAAGMPIICSTTCGASVHLVQDGYNGYVVPPKDPKMLADRMVRISIASNAELDQMGHASYQLSLQFTPVRWAQTVLAHIRELIGGHTSEAEFSYSAEKQ